MRLRAGSFDSPTRRRVVLSPNSDCGSLILLAEAPGDADHSFLETINPRKGGRRYARAPVQTLQSLQPWRNSLAQVTRYPNVKQFPLWRLLDRPRKPGDTAVVVIELDCCPLKTDFATTRDGGIIGVQQEIIG